MRKNSWEKHPFGQGMQKEMGFSSSCAQGDQKHGIMLPFTPYLQEDSCDVKAGPGRLRGNSTALSASSFGKHACCGAVRHAGEDGKCMLSFEPWLTCCAASKPMLAHWSGEIGPGLVHNSPQKTDVWRGLCVQHHQQVLSHMPCHVPVVGQPWVLLCVML